MQRISNQCTALVRRLLNLYPSHSFISIPLNVFLYRRCANSGLPQPEIRHFSCPLWQENSNARMTWESQLRWVNPIKDLPANTLCFGELEKLCWIGLIFVKYVTFEIFCSLWLEDLFMRFKKDLPIFAISWLSVPLGFVKLAFLLK